MLLFFVCNDTATTDSYTDGHTLSLHDALPISIVGEDIVGAAIQPVLIMIIEGGSLQPIDRPPFHQARRRPFIVPSAQLRAVDRVDGPAEDRKSTRLNSSH